PQQLMVGPMLVFNMLPSDRAEMPRAYSHAATPVHGRVAVEGVYRRSPDSNGRMDRHFDVRGQQLHASPPDQALMISHSGTPRSPHSQLFRSTDPAA
ncbi:MAG TPA: hypothetical protein VFI46_11580, partial [Jiangellaceae bacterium]|nr:hypothetical protein [Jiangellaceae bacterium]